MIESPTGSGKTTQLVPILLSDPRFVNSKVACVTPQGVSWGLGSFLIGEIVSNEQT